MASYLEALNPLAWEVTDKAMGVMDEDQTKWNARAKNAMFDAISVDIFARVYSKKTAHEVWKELENIHVGFKYQVLKEKLNEFKMHPSELVEQMYAKLNVLVEDITHLKFLLCLLVTLSGRFFTHCTSPSTTLWHLCSMRKIFQHCK